MSLKERKAIIAWKRHVSRHIHKIDEQKFPLAKNTRPELRQVKENGSWGRVDREGKMGAGRKGEKTTLGVVRCSVSYWYGGWGSREVQEKLWEKDRVSQDPKDHETWERSRTCDRLEHQCWFIWARKPEWARSACFAYCDNTLFKSIIQVSSLKR